MTLRAYIEAVAVLAVVGAPIAAAAAAVRRRLVPGWGGAEARLAEIIVALSVLTVLSEALGSVGWFHRAPLMLGALAVGAALLLLCRRAWPVPSPSPQPVSPPGEPRRWVGASALAVAVSIQWLALTRPALDTGILSNDSRQYHLPIAADFVQTGWLSRFYFLWIDPTWTFYPANGDLFHAVGMLALNNDSLSVPMNVGWLALALLAAWCIGRPYGVGHLTLAATAVLVSSPGFAAGQAASALNDIALLALLLSMLVFLLRVNHHGGSLVLAGLAAGLAAGTKYTALAPVAAATVVVLLRARREHRVRAMATWLGSCALTGGFWYLRNTVRIGNPIPQVLTMLPRPRFPALDAYGSSIIDYATDGSFWRHVVPDGLRSALGRGWVVVVALGAIGVVLAIISSVRRGDAPLSRANSALLAGTAAFAAAAYVAADGSAFGPAGTPFQFALNVRYGFPALCIALIALVLRVGPRWHAPLFGALTIGVALNLTDASAIGESTVQSSSTRVLVALALGALGAVWLVTVVVRRRGWSRQPLIGLALAGTVLIGIGVGRKAETHYLARRYSDIPIATWARTVHHARIGVVGLPEQYPLFGSDLSNQVQYIGQRGPHGGFTSIHDCNEFRAAVARGDFDYVVTGSTKWFLEPAPEREWLATDPGATDLHVVGTRLTGADVLSVYAIDAGTVAEPCP